MYHRAYLNLSTNWIADDSLECATYKVKAFVDKVAVIIISKTN